MEKKYHCKKCDGLGERMQQRDLHRSEGIVSCDNCHGKGYLNEQGEEFMRRLGYGYLIGDIL